MNALSHEAHQGYREKEHKSGVPAGSRRALVVDDHADTAELFRVLLSKRGFDVVVAGTFRTAVEAAKETEFDILISDIDLPDGNGCDLLEELRRTQSLPAIAVSGLGGENVQHRCKEVGFDELFVKPASFQRVLDATFRLLSERPSSLKDPAL